MQFRMGNAEWEHKYFFLKVGVAQRHVQFNVKVEGRNSVRDN